jgi:hypothetical protein
MSLTYFVDGSFLIPIIEGKGGKRMNTDGIIIARIRNGSDILLSVAGTTKKTDFRVEKNF